MIARARARSARVLLTFVVVATVLVPLAPAALTQDLQQVEARKNELERQIGETTAAIDDLAARIALAADELGTLEQRTVELEVEAARANQALARRARAAYMRGQTIGVLPSLLSAEGPTIALDRARMMNALSQRDVAAYESATALRTEIDQTRTLLTAKSDELNQLRADLEARSGALQQAFRDVSELYAELKSRHERQQIISNGAQQGVYACIFEPPFHYRNTWGAPRSGGRSHKGTDVMAAHGQRVYAFTNGTIRRMSSSGLGGIGLYLWGDDGIEYFYAHLSGYAPGIYSGKRVEAGQLIAYNGSTGNARGGAPHVHFEVHPGGGGPVNPYHWLTPVC